MSDGDEPWKRAQSWQSMAIAGAIIIPVIILFATPWVLAAEDEGGLLQRIQIIAAAAAVPLALVTFCTVVWRGLISSRQAELQARQIEGLTRQLAATEENNTAAIFQKGAELIGEVDKPAKTTAGVACLEAVVTTPNTRFGSQAMNVLADFVQRSFKHDSPDFITQSAVMAMRRGADQGYEAARLLQFSTDSTEFDDTKGAGWLVVRGTWFVAYKGGRAWVEDDDLKDLPHVSFSGVRFDGARIWMKKGAPMYRACTFHHCKIVEIDLSYSGDCVFVGCDFRETDFSNVSSGSILKGRENRWRDDIVPEFFRHV